MKLAPTNIAIVFSLLASYNYSQWSNDPDVNLRLTNWGDWPISAVEDGKGGAFISTSFNAPLDHEPWAAKYPNLLWIDKYGHHNLDTARVLGGHGEKYRDLKLMKDGTGNYIAVFVDQVFLYYIENYAHYRDRIIIQKFDSLGNKLWGDGVYISTDTSNAVAHTLFETAIDGKGGCFIYYEAWDSVFRGDKGKRLVQHISPDGQRLWGDTGITLYEGRISWNIFANNILFDGNDGIITFYQNTYLINLDYEGNILWKLPPKVQPNDHYKMTLINKNEFAFFRFEYEPPLEKMLFDKISLQGIYIDSAITLSENIDGRYIKNISIIGDKIFLQSYVRTLSSIFINYIEKFDSDGNSYFGNKGILVLDTLGSIAKMFNTDSSIVVVTHHYAQAIDFEGNNLWEPKILQYTKRFMGYNDVVSDGNGGFIACWLENLDGVWGQQVSAQGKLGEVVTNIIDTQKDILPGNYILGQNYPNPFNPSTTITYSLPVEGYIELKIFDILGREIAVLEKGEKNVGTYNIVFDTKDYQSLLPSGVYFYTLLVKDQFSHLLTYKFTKKMLLLK
jgi:hypothetical protein